MEQEEFDVKDENEEKEDKKDESGSDNEKKV
jgi:hypothetical protein